MRHLTLEEIQLGLEVYEKFLLHEAYLKNDKQSLVEIKLSFKGIKDLGKKALDKFKSLAPNEKAFVGLLGKLKKETNKEAKEIINFIKSKAKEYKNKSLKDIQNDIEKLYNEFIGKEVNEALSNKARKIGGFLALALYLATSLIPSAFASADAIAGLDNVPSMETPVDLEGGDDPNAIDYNDAEALAAASSGTDIAYDTVKSGVQDQGVKVKLGDIGGAYSFDTGEFDASQADIDEVAQDVVDDLEASLGGKDLIKVVIDYFGLISNTPGDQDNNEKGPGNDKLGQLRVNTAKKIADKVLNLLKDKYPDADISVGESNTNIDSVDSQKEVDKGSKEASSTQVAGVSLDDIETGEKETKDDIKPDQAKARLISPKLELDNKSRYRSLLSLFLPLLIDDYDKTMAKVANVLDLEQKDFPITRKKMEVKRKEIRDKASKTEDELLTLKILDWSIGTSKAPSNLRNNINKLDPKVALGKRALKVSKAPGTRGKNMGIAGTGKTQGNTGDQSTSPSKGTTQVGESLIETLSILLEGKTDFSELPGYNSSKAKSNLGILVPAYAAYWASEPGQTADGTVLPTGFDIDYVMDTYKDSYRKFEKDYPIISKQVTYDDYQDVKPSSSQPSPAKPKQARDAKGRFTKTEPTPPSKDSKKTPEEKPQRARDEKGRFKKTEPTLPQVDKDPNIEPDVIDFRQAVEKNTPLRNKLKLINNKLELTALYTACISYVNDNLMRSSTSVVNGLRNAVSRVDIKEERENIDPAKVIQLLDGYTNLRTLLLKINTQEELIDLLLNGITPFINPAIQKSSIIKQALVDAAKQFKEDSEMTKSPKDPKYNIQRMGDDEIKNLSDIDIIQKLLASPYSSMKQRILLRKRYSDLVKEEKLSKSQIKRRDKLAKDIKKNTVKQYGKKEGEAAAYAIATNQVKEDDCGCGCGDSKVNHTINELIENLVYEELCKRGKAYIAARKRAGEKSSAYLSGRAVKVCKGQIKGAGGKRKKSYKNESLYNQLKPQVLNHLEELFNDPHFAIIAEYNVKEANIDESLKNWFGKEDWVRIDTQGNIAGKCGTMPKGKATQRCLPRAKANSLTKAQRASTSRKKVRGSKKGKQFVRNTKKAKVSFKKK